MSFNNDSELDMDQIAAFLQDAVNKVKTEENADLLNDLKKVYRKNVPLSLRGYVTAYLVKEAQLRQHSRFGRRDNDRSQSRYKKSFRENNRSRFEDRTPSRDTKPAKDTNITPITAEITEERTPRPRVQIDEALASTIFISIGRNRRVYPRDLVGLLISVAGLDRDRIGDIRVLANYSFVQLFKEDTEKAIAALNNYDYRGRKLAVSYSRQKDEDAEMSMDSNASEEDAKAYAAAEKAASYKEPFSAPLHTGDSSDSSSDSNGFLV